MSVNAVNPTQQISTKQQPKFTEKVKKAVDFNKDGDVKLEGSLLALSVAGLAAIGLALKGKAGKIDVNLKDFDFKNIPSNFSGKVGGNLKNGDSILLEYKDGILKSSNRSGKVNFSKVYEEIDGNKIVKKTVDGKTETFNLTKTQNAVKEQQTKLKNLLSNSKKYSSNEIAKQADEIQYKSKQQTQEIQNTIDYKKGIKAEAETRALIKQQEKEAVAKARELEDKFIDKQLNPTRIKKAELEEAFANKAETSAQTFIEKEAEATNLYERTRADLELEYMTGKKANKSAKESANVFIEQKDELKRIQKQVAKELENADKELAYATGPKYHGDSKGTITKTFLSSPTSVEQKEVQEAAVERIAGDGIKTTQKAVQRKVKQQTSNPAYKNALRKLQNKSNDALQAILNNPKKHNNTEVKVAQDLLNSRK